MGPKKSKKYKAAAKAARVDVASKEVSAKKKFMAMKKNRSKGKMPHNKPKKKKSAKVRRAARVAVGPKERKAKRVLKKAALKKAAAKKGESVNEYRRKLVIHHIEDKHEKKVARGIGAHEGKAKRVLKKIAAKKKKGGKKMAKMKKWARKSVKPSIVGRKKKSKKPKKKKKSKRAKKRAKLKRAARVAVGAKERKAKHAYGIMHAKHLEAKERRRKGRTCRCREQGGV